jgi:hypothetical protein
MAIANSLIVCAIGLRTSQLGFIPANLFCICVNAFSMRPWLKAQIHTNRVKAQKQDSGLVADARRGALRSIVPMPVQPQRAPKDSFVHIQLPPGAGNGHLSGLQGRVISGGKSSILRKGVDRNRKKVAADNCTKFVQLLRARFVRMNLTHCEQLLPTHPQFPSPYLLVQKNRQQKVALPGKIFHKVVPVKIVRLT